MGRGTCHESYDAIVSKIDPGGTIRVMSIPPLMHGAAQWATFYYMTMGATVVFPSNTVSLDPVDVWHTVERERIIGISVVGDAMARPIVEELERGNYDASSLMAFGSGGAILSVTMKERMLACLPNLIISDVAGASETGVQVGQMSVSGSVGTTSFVPGPGAVVVSEDMTRVLVAGDQEIGWLAQQGSVPLGYLGDQEKSARTFPFIDGIPHSIPGDRARLLADGQVELLGRDSVTINSGGEKIFAEEVELAILHHPAVADVVVAGRPSERWGNEVVAIVQVSDGHTVTAQEIIAEAGRHLARYNCRRRWRFTPTSCGRRRARRTTAGRRSRRSTPERSAHQCATRSVSAERPPTGVDTRKVATQCPSSSSTTPAPRWR